MVNSNLPPFLGISLFHKKATSAYGFLEDAPEFATSKHVDQKIRRGIDCHSQI